MEITEQKRTVNNICRYFDGKVIGTYLLVQLDLLKIEDIHDIDIAISELKLDNVRSYLSDKGYNETSPPKNYPGYKPEEGSLKFNHRVKKEGFLPIHLIVWKERFMGVFSVKELLAEKIKRGFDHDLITVRKVLDKMIK
jgi:hypothetical protein